MRPTTRPEKPYTAADIPTLAKRIYDHFITEGNPKGTTSSGMCIYGLTGCAVGCLLTAEDAERVDNLISSGTSISYLLPGSDVLQEYFTYNDENLLDFLTKAQVHHDEAPLNTVDFSELEVFLESVMRSGV